MGFGATSTKNPTTSTVLLQVTIDAVAQNKCRDIYGQSEITDNMICASRSGSDSCWGDSGGPLITNTNNNNDNDILLGIVSWGYECADKTYPGVYARIETAYTWIQDTMCSMSPYTHTGSCAPTPAPNTNIAPETLHPTSNCMDVHNWRDSFGDTCAWYEQDVGDDDRYYDEKDNRCDYWGDCCTNNGYTALTACCACGGGVERVPVPTQAPITPSPTLAPTILATGVNILETNFLGKSVYYGNMFDLYAKQPQQSIQLYSMAVHLHSAVGTLENLHVYSKLGSYVGFEMAPSKWTLNFKANGIASQGNGQHTNLAHSSYLDGNPIMVVPAGQTLALYVTTTSGNLVYSHGSTVGNVYSENSHLRIYEGVAVGNGFQGLVYGPRVWNGVMRYVVEVDSSVSPTESPSVSPTSDPSSKPSVKPSVKLSSKPSVNPSSKPSEHPSTGPTPNPSVEPTAYPSARPSNKPSENPTASPTSKPTASPTASPTQKPTSKPTSSPTVNPTHGPTQKPTAHPTVQPSEDVGGVVEAPGNDTAPPSTAASALPTDVPTRIMPTKYPTVNPTGSPTDAPTGSPTEVPASDPTDVPTKYPTAGPSAQPTYVPTASPTSEPTYKPTYKPTSSPTYTPTPTPTTKPTLTPSEAATITVGSGTTSEPSPYPTNLASHSYTPSYNPTSHPSNIPSTIPPQSAAKLATTYAGGTQMDGAMFDIINTSSSSIFITNLELHVEATSGLELQLYRRNASHKNRERHKNAWKLLATIQNINGQGYNNPTLLPEQSFDPILFQPGKTKALFVSFVDYGAYRMYLTNGKVDKLAVFDVFVSNGDLELLVGVGKRFGFANSYKGYVWNGALVYTVGTKAAASSGGVVVVDNDNDPPVIDDGTTASSSAAVGNWLSSAAPKYCMIAWSLLTAVEFLWILQ